VFYFGRRSLEHETLKQKRYNNDETF